MSKDGKDPTGILIVFIVMAVILGIVVLVVLLTLYSTFVLFQLYNWFGVTAGLPVLGFWHIYGLSLIPQFLLANLAMKGSDGGNKSLLYSVFLSPLLFLLLGWVVHTFLM